MNESQSNEKLIILSRIAGRFFNLHSGTPIEPTRRRLRSNRHLLDELRNDEHILIESQQYFPTYKGIDMLGADLRNLSRQFMSITLSSLQILYLGDSDGRHNFRIEEILGSALKIHLGTEKNEILLGLFLCRDFPYFTPSSYSGDNPLDIEQVSVRETIMDFESISKTIEAYESREPIQSWSSDKLEHPIITSLSDTQEIDFSFISDDKLMKIIQRDYHELLTLQRSNALKSRMILSGSIIEAILLDKLSQDSERAQKNSKASSRPIEEWRLATIIDVADDLGLISAAAQTYGHSVREYRNLIHPGKELRSKLTLGTEEVEIAEKVLAIVIRDLQDDYKGST